MQVYRSGGYGSNDGPAEVPAGRRGLARHRHGHRGRGAAGPTRDSARRTTENIARTVSGKNLFLLCEVHHRVIKV